LSGRAHGTNGAAPLAISLLNEQLQPEAVHVAFLSAITPGRQTWHVHPGMRRQGAFSFEAASPTLSTALRTL